VPALFRAAAMLASLNLQNLLRGNKASGALTFSLSDPTELISKQVAVCARISPSLYALQTIHF